MLCNLLSLLYIIYAEVSEWQTSKIQVLVSVTLVRVQVPSSALIQNTSTKKVEKSIDG